MSAEIGRLGVALLAALAWALVILATGYVDDYPKPVPCDSDGDCERRCAP